MFVDKLKISLFYVNILLFLSLFVSYLFGLYAKDLLHIACYLSVVSIFFLENHSTSHQLKLKVTQFKSIFILIVNWIFYNPWKIGLITFFILLFSYGFKLSIDGGYGYDTGIFLQILSYPYFDGHYLYTTLNNTQFSFFGVHFEPYLFLLHFISYLPYPNIFLYGVAYAALSTTLVYGLKILQESKNLTLYIKFVILLSCFSFYFWQGLCVFEFHELALVPLFHVLMFRSWQKKSYVQFIIFTVIALCLKETIAITFMYCGVLIFIFSKNFTRNISTILFILGAAFYFFNFKIITPAVRHSTESLYLRYYSPLGNTAVEVLLSPILKPEAFLSALFAKHNLIYLITILFPLLPFLKKGWKFLLFAGPTLFLSMLSLKFGYTNPEEQYGGELVVPMCLVVYYGATHLQEKINLGCLGQVQKKFTLAFSVFCFLYFLNANPVRSLKHQFAAKEEILFARQLQKIPQDKVVYTNVAPALPFLAVRSGLIYDDKDEFIGRSKLNLPIDYVVYQGDIHSFQEVSPDHLQLIVHSKDYALYQVTR